MPKKISAGRSGLAPSLRAMFVAVAVAVILPFLFVVGYLAYGEVSQEKHRLQREALTQARTLAGQIEKHLGSRLETMAGAAAAIGAGGKGEGVAEAQARRLRQVHSDVEAVLVVDDLGVAMATVPPVAGARRVAVSDQSWFKRAATTTEPFVGGAWQAGPDIFVGIYAPARAPEGQFRGVVAADVSLRPVQETLGQASVHAGAVVEVVSDRALVLARHPALFLLDDVQRLPGYPELVRRQGGVGELVFEDGERRLIGAAAIRPAGWVLAVGLSPAHVLADTNARIRTAGWMAVAAALLGVVAALLIGRRQSRGMEQLRVAMGRLGTGNIPASLPVAVGAEIGALTEGFNRMLSWLRGRVQEYEAVSRVEEVTGAALGGERSIDGVLPGLLRRVVGGMGADVGVLVVEEGGALVAKAAVGLTGIETEGVRLRRGQGLAGAVWAGREPVTVQDAAADYRLEEPYLKEAGLHSVVGVPILTGDEVVGVLEVGHRLPHVFAEGEIQRLEAMARRAGQALAHVRAHDAVRLNTAGLEAQVAEQLGALQRAAAEQVEARGQAQEARRQAQELEQKMRVQAAQAPQVREVIVEKEVVRLDPAGGDAARLRVAMLKTVSEELRAPLTALLDLPRFLVEGLSKPLGEDARQQLEILRDRSEEVLELIDSLVVLSGLEGGRIKITKAPFDLPTLIHRVVRGVQPRAAAKGNRIDADIKLGVGQVVSDAKWLGQILTSLLVAAIKYTEVGEIRVTCYVREADVVLTVADDGAGFSPEEQVRIFEPFLQVGPREGRKFPGTGLLLTVSQRLVGALGGRIKVESEVDRGTWFTVTLPSESS